MSAKRFINALAKIISVTDNIDTDNSKKISKEIFNKHFSNSILIKEIKNKRGFKKRILEFLKDKKIINQLQIDIFKYYLSKIFSKYEFFSLFSLTRERSKYAKDFLYIYNAIKEKTDNSN